MKSDYLTITFTPADRSLMAFVNAIEVFSAPRDLISDLAWSNLDKGFKNWTLLDQALEFVYRINIGGGKVTPFDDTLWRTWTADDFLSGVHIFTMNSAKKFLRIAVQIGSSIITFQSQQYHREL